MCTLCIVIVLECLHCIVIEARIPTPEDLEGKDIIRFPDASTNVSSLFGSMTPMIELPSTAVLRQGIWAINKAIIRYKQSFMGQNFDNWSGNTLG